MRLVNGVGVSPLFTLEIAEEVSSLVSDTMRHAPIGSKELCEAWIEADKKGLEHCLWRGLLESFARFPYTIDPVFLSDSGVFAVWGSRYISFRDYSVSPSYIYSSPYKGWLKCSSSAVIGCTQYPISIDRRSLGSQSQFDLCDRTTPVFVDGSKVACDYEVKSSGVGFRLYEHSDETMVSMFDKKTRSLVGQTPLVSKHSEIVLALKVLATAKAPEAEEVARMALGSSAHFVRWEAAKVLSQLAPVSVEEMLVKLTSDPHPEVRNAAAQSIALIEKKK
jgi:hypothetical protein